MASSTEKVTNKPQITQMAIQQSAESPPPQSKWIGGPKI
jgi:hypothetical protein